MGDEWDHKLHDIDSDLKVVESVPVNRILPLGVPVETQDVLHAPTFLSEVTDRLWDGQSIMIVGPRRIGKV